MTALRLVKRGRPTADCLPSPIVTAGHRAALMVSLRSRDWSSLHPGKNVLAIYTGGDEFLGSVQLHCASGRIGAHCVPHRPWGKADLWHLERFAKAFAREVSQ